MKRPKHELTFEAVQHFLLARERSTQKRQALLEALTEDVMREKRRWTITQLHILSLVNSNQCGMNNASLAAELHVSKPAVTKAVNILVEHQLLLTSKKSDNQKELYYDVTDKGRQLAAVHDQMHNN
ncbi:MarR family transcriptional regulator [Paenibacillus sp. BJ-4]|uniref:MarR family transcriptional regulator n=1 Tax=Paenibacillus sp. BJ-4 TaxID=2878097 RepID=UPI001CF07242|nr:MarR family transcriptional regulator [Paenibacillus sp. BJ-4]